MNYTIFLLKSWNLCGKISQNTKDNFQSHYFIKFNKPTNQQYLNLQSIKFSGKNNTVGARSISKAELIKEFNVIF